MEVGHLKKGVILALLIGMFIWAIYDFVIQSNDVSSSEDTKTLTKAESEEKSDGTELVIGLDRGNLAPDFELQSLTGETVKLSDFRGEKVMVNFWATWCPPCRAEMPDMQRFYEDTDIVILAVNLTETTTERNHVPRFVDEYGLTFPVLLDENLIAATLYRIQPIPTSYLINSDGTIHNMAFGALNYELMIQEYHNMH